MLRHWQKNIEKYYAPLSIVLFFVSYLLFFPGNIIITDEYAYVSQAIAFSQGLPSLQWIDPILEESFRLTYPPYHLGTSAYYSLFVALFGAPYIFVGSLVAVVLSALLIHRIIEREAGNPLALSLFWISIPLLFFVRTSMSGVPSLLLISLALYFFLKRQKKARDWFFVGLFCSAGLWFRETNMLILLPLLAWSLYKEKPHFSLVFGILLGVLLECLANYWVYGSAWFVSGSAGFSLSGAPQRFALYALLLCFAIPGGLWFLVTYRSKADKTLLFIVSIFISCYILYDYSAIAYSGWLKGSLLTSRFILPIIPIFCVFLACHPIPYPKIKRKITLAFALISLVLIPCSQGYFHRELAAHEQAAHSLNAYLQDAIVSYDMEGFSNTIRYFHPLHWKEQQLSRITHIDQFKTTAQQLDKFRLVISRNTGNAEKDQRSQQMIERYSTLMQQLDTTFHIDNDLRLEVWKCKGS